MRDALEIVGGAVAGGLAVHFLWAKAAADAQKLVADVRAAAAGFDGRIKNIESAIRGNKAASL